QKAKQPYFVRAKDAEIFCFAGVMAYWKNPKGEPLRSCAILTAKAEGALAQIHDRAPVVLPADAWGAWLDRKLTDPAKAKALAERRVAPSGLVQRKVRLLVNNAKSDGPELIEPVKDDGDPTSAE